MDLEKLVKLIKQKLLEGWILACCAKDCVERLRGFTDVIYVYEGSGLAVALVRRAGALKRLFGVSDEELKKLRVLLFDLTLARATGLCFTDMGFANEMDEVEAERIAKAVLEDVLKTKTLRIHMEHPA